MTPHIKHRLNCLGSLRKRLEKRHDPNACAQLEHAVLEVHEEILSAKSAFETKLHV